MKSGKRPSSTEYARPQVPFHEEQGFLDYISPFQAGDIVERDLECILVWEYCRDAPFAWKFRVRSKDEQSRWLETPFDKRDVLITAELDLCFRHKDFPRMNWLELKPNVQRMFRRSLKKSQSDCPFQMDRVQLFIVKTDGHLVPRSSIPPNPMRVRIGMKSLPDLWLRVPSFLNLQVVVKQIQQLLRCRLEKKSRGAPRRVGRTPRQVQALAMWRLGREVGGPRRALEWLQSNGRHRSIDLTSFTREYRRLVAQARLRVMDLTPQERTYNSLE